MTTPAATRTPAAAAPPEDTRANVDGPESYGWNIGSGITSAPAAFSDIPAGVFATPSALVRAPSYALSVERRLGATTWLFVGTTILYRGEDAIARASDDTERTVRRTFTTLGGLLGIRQIVVSHVVDLSIWGALSAARLAIGGDRLNADETISGSVRPGSDAVAVGFSAGLALERELLEALSVRLTAQVGSVNNVSESNLVIDNGQEEAEEASRLSLELYLRPGLALHFYF